MSQVEMAQYLDSCSELLAVTSNLAALHIQAFSDPVVTDSVNGIQALTLGLSGKIWIGQTNAIDMGLGFYGYGYRGGCFRDRDGRAICDRRYGHGSSSVHVDYLWESKLIDRTAQLDWHIGAGARAFFLGDPCAYDCWDVGARAPLGLDLTFHQPSFLEVFLEIAPVFYFAPAMFMAMEGGLGVRGYF